MNQNVERVGIREKSNFIQELSRLRKQLDIILVISYNVPASYVAVVEYVVGQSRQNSARSVEQWLQIFQQPL